ncbi:MAG: DUF3592 domain-containing protein [Denitromonas halophila]|nr:MAG: DUF3592 domain-containing protein [Denitromonas halophila]TVT63930.1 MAG: DUF3592 domain-containing protein [Denitromonas halophila]
MSEYIADMWRLALDGEKRGILFFASTYVFVMLVYSGVYQLRIAKWFETDGVLLAAAVEKVGGADLVMSNQDYASKALYEYVVGGVSYQGTRISPWIVLASHNARFVLERQMRKIQKTADGHVRVFYNPSNPGKSFLVKPGGFGIVVTFTLAVAPVVLYWLGYHG